MPVRNLVPIGDVVIEFASCAEVVVAWSAVVTDMVYLVPAPLPALVVPLVRGVAVSFGGSVVVSFVERVVWMRGIRLVPTVGAMPVVVVIS
jgi:hypothetical protein